ncbi:hypothetical protein ACSBR1_001037 [Camellia fascicularis]
MNHHPEKNAFPPGHTSIGVQSPSQFRLKVGQNSWFHKPFFQLLFSAVCKPWHHVALEDNNNNDHHHHKQRQRLDILRTCHNKHPMLMIETKENNKEKRDLFSVSEGITCEVKLPLPYNNTFCGSAHGWLFTIERTNMAITLLNPFIYCGFVKLPVLNDPYGEHEYWVNDDTCDYFIIKGIL